MHYYNDLSSFFLLIKRGTVDNTVRSTITIQDQTEQNVCRLEPINIHLPLAPCGFFSPFSTGSLVQLVNRSRTVRESETRDQGRSRTGGGRGGLENLQMWCHKRQPIRETCSHIQIQKDRKLQNASKKTRRRQTARKRRDDKSDGLIQQDVDVEVHAVNSALKLQV